MRERNEEEPRIVVRDKRRIDPVTGQPREPDAVDSGSGGPARSGARPPLRPAEPDPVAELERQLRERTDDLQRLGAEYANYRRRVDRDRAAVGEQATASVLAALLPILDDLDRARQHGDLTGPFATLAEQLEGVLAKFGLVAFVEPGDPFDPNRHEAVMHTTRPDVRETTCVEVLRRGYSMGERMIRPAMVVVADPDVPAPGEAPDQPADQTSAAEAPDETRID